MITLSEDIGLGLDSCLAVTALVIMQCVEVERDEGKGAFTTLGGGGSSLPLTYSSSFLGGLDCLSVLTVLFYGVVERNSKTCYVFFSYFRLPACWSFLEI